MSEEISREEIAALLARGEEMTREEAKAWLEHHFDPIPDGTKQSEAVSLAIKALEQEPICPSHGIDCEDCPAYDPCGDAISREDALMALTGEWTEITDEIIHRFIKRIKALPSVTPQPKTGWIPVSEGLPKRNGQYLVTKTIGNYNLIDCIEYSTNLAKTDRFHFRGKNYAGWYEYDIDYGYLETHGVIAWMPLPKPYEPHESEE